MPGWLTIVLSPLGQWFPLGQGVREGCSGGTPLPPVGFWPHLQMSVVVIALGEAPMASSGERPEDPPAPMSLVLEDCAVTAGPHLPHFHMGDPSSFLRSHGQRSCQGRGGEETTSEQHPPCSQKWHGLCEAI